MIENNEELYFDTEEYEDIIIYYLEMGDISYAELATKYALKLHPNSLEIKVKLLEVLLELEQHGKAKQLIEELKNASMESTDFLVCCAKYYSNLGNSRRAIEFCEKALKLEEEENFLHNFIGDEYYNLDDPFKALKHYKLALKFDPQDDFALENALACYQAMNRGNEALDFFAQLFGSVSVFRSSLVWVRAVSFQQKNFEEAIKGFDYVLAINSESVEFTPTKHHVTKQWDNGKRLLRYMKNYWN